MLAKHCEFYRFAAEFGGTEPLRRSRATLVRINWSRAISSHSSQRRSSKTYSSSAISPSAFATTPASGRLTFPPQQMLICASVQDESGQASDVNPACAVRGADSSVTVQREAHRLADFARAASTRLRRQRRSQERDCVQLSRAPAGSSAEAASFRVQLSFTPASRRSKRVSW